MTDPDDASEPMVEDDTSAQLEREAETRAAAAHEDAIEQLEAEALPKVKDVKLEYRIDQLKSAGDLFSEAKQSGASRGRFAGLSREDTRIRPAKTEKGWYRKSERAKRAVLEKMMGTHGPSGTAKKEPLPGPMYSEGLPRLSLKERNASQELREL